MIKICTLSQECLDEICLIEQLSFAQPWSRASFEKELENSIAKYTVLMDCDTVLGYGGFWAITDEGHITNVAVHPLNRKMGCGSKIVTAMVEKAKLLGLRLLTLEVRRSNEAAKALYEKFGFEVVGERRKYYSQPTEDALLMTKYL